MPDTSLRRAEIERKTLETQITATLNLDGTGDVHLDTELPFFSHMLHQSIWHGRMDLHLTARGDLAVDAHHTVEDIGIVLGQTLAKAIGTKESIQRYGHAYVPLDEALSRVVVDFSGRPHLTYPVQFTRPWVSDFDTDLLREFFQGFVNHAQLTLHIDNLRGENTHHQAESIFKAFGIALHNATRMNTREGTPSTKGML